MLANQAVTAGDMQGSSHVCLDFSNTMNWHASEYPIEELTSYADLVAWAVRAGLLAEEEAATLTRAAAAAPDEAGRVLEQAIALREAIYRIFSATAGGRSPDPADLAILNASLAVALSRLQLNQESGRFVWQWLTDGADLDCILWPVTRSAAELLVSPDLNRVKECADDRGCGYLFFDASRNRSRRWCDMEACGNRAKALRHYRRKRAG